MNQEKIGKFIAQLRKERNISQEQLAEKLYLTRQAISKWESGKSLPDGYNLQKLGEIFDVTVNELLAGEHINKDNEQSIINFQLNLYEDRNKKIVLIRKILIILITVCCCFLGYYFINFYNSVKVYTINGNNENIRIDDGFLVVTKEKIYFQLGKINNVSGIKNLRLFYTDKKDTVYTIYTCQECQDISLVDKVGYDQYFNYKDMGSLINNMKIEIQFDNNVEVIKLKFKRDYSNNKLFSTVDFKSSKQEVNKNYINHELLNLLKSKLSKSDDGYNATKRIDNKEISIVLLDNILYIELKENDIIENITYNFQFNSLAYDKYNNGIIDSSLIMNFNNSICESENNYCDKKEVVINNFNNLLKMFAETV